MKRIRIPPLIDILRNRRGGSTLEYVTILAVALLIGTILYHTLANDGRQALQATLDRIFSLEDVSFDASIDTKEQTQDIPSSSVPTDDPSPPHNFNDKPQDIETDSTTVSISTGSIESDYTPTLTEDEESDIRKSCREELTPNNRFALAGKYQSCVDKHVEAKKEALTACQQHRNEPIYDACVNSLSQVDNNPSEIEKVIVDATLDNIPFIGNVKSIYETVWGQDIYGEELSTGDRLLSGAGSLTPWLKNIKHFKHLDSIDDIKSAQRKEGPRKTSPAEYAAKVSDRTTVKGEYSESRWKGDRSGILREELYQANIKPPPYPNAAHHIVPWNDPRAQEARKVLDSYGIETESAVNGVFLPYLRNEHVTNEAMHVGSHGMDYIEDINTRLQRLKREGKTKKRIVDELNQIREELISGKLKLN
jgi:hypothetical protein